jgi:signal transduction histidine kinase
MIESLLTFSRTGASMRRAPELMATLLERAAAVVRAHPDAEGVSLVTRCGDPAETVIIADGKQIERAVCNLLLNACQAVRAPGTAASVVMTLTVEEKQVIVSILDNGQGVPDSIRHNLFEPFVSEGKQKGTGLGLTLAHCISAEHGGEVVLLRSCPGETIFQLKLLRALPPSDAQAASEPNRYPQVIEHEKQPI